MKKRKLRVGRLIMLIAILACIVFLLVMGITKLISHLSASKEIATEETTINELDYSEMKEFEFDLHSQGYMLVRINDFKVLYGKNLDEQFYPASLTKVVTLDTVINDDIDLNDTSYITSDDYNSLIDADASLAGLKVNYDYSIGDLLYALILPSGGDAALALENYYTYNEMNLVDDMGKLAEKLNLENSSFVNTTGLHQSNLYTTLNDYSKVVLDALNNTNSKKYLKTLTYDLEGKELNSTLISLTNNDENIEIYGGKTGYTPYAGENILVLYTYNNRSYMLILYGANGNPYNGENYHLNDVKTIFSELYN